MTSVSNCYAGGVDFSAHHRAEHTKVSEFMACTVSTIEAAAAEAGVERFFGGDTVNINISNVTRNLPPFAAAELENAIQDLKSAVQGMIKQAQSNSSSSGASGSVGKGWLRELAEILAKVLDNKANELKGLSKAAHLSKEANADLQAATHEFGMLFQAAINAIKTIGESMASGARK